MASKLMRKETGAAQRPRFQELKLYVRAMWGGIGGVLLVLLVALAALTLEGR